MCLINVDFNFVFHHCHHCFRHFFWVLYLPTFLLLFFFFFFFFFALLPVAIAVDYRASPDPINATAWFIHLISAFRCLLFSVCRLSFHISHTHTHTHPQPQLPTHPAHKWMQFNHFRLNLIWINLFQNILESYFLSLFSLFTIPYFSISDNKLKSIRNRLSKNIWFDLFFNNIQPEVINSFANVPEHFHTCYLKLSWF